MDGAPLFKLSPDTPHKARAMFNTFFRIAEPPADHSIHSDGFYSTLSEEEKVGLLKPYLKNGVDVRELAGKEFKVSFHKVQVGRKSAGYFPDAPYVLSLTSPYSNDKGHTTAFVLAAFLPITTEFLKLDSDSKMGQLKLMTYAGLEESDLCIAQLQARIEGQGTIFEHFHAWDLILDNLVEYAIVTNCKRIAIPKPENIYWLGPDGKPLPSYQTRYVDFIKAYTRKLIVDTNRLKDTDNDQGVRFEVNFDDPNFTFININLVKE